MSYTLGGGGRVARVPTYIPPIAPPVDPPSNRMTPPSGAVLHRNLLVKEDWTTEVDGFLTQPPGTGPGGDPIVRSTLVDDFNSNPGANAAERNDMTAGSVPIGSTRCMIWDQRVLSLPSNITTQGGFNLLGPCEIHGSTRPQATVQPLIGTAWHDPSWRGHHVFEANGGSATHEYVYVAPLVLGEWRQWKLVVKYTFDNTGYVELWRDNVLLFSKYNFSTAGENVAGVWKMANYRNPEMTGTTQHEVSGTRIYRVGAL